MSLIELTGVTKTYTVGGVSFPALCGVDLKIEEGEFVALMGPSGSGKSTLLSVLAGLTPPSEGRVVVDGIEVQELDPDRLAAFRSEYVGIVFQQFQLIPYLTALQNTMLPLSVTGLSGSEQVRLATEALTRVGLGEKLDRLPNQLSGGEQERVAIARAVVNAPPILLADEPTGALDTKTGQEIMGLFAKLHAEGQTIIMVTHNPENGRQAERAIVIRDGRLG
ncbi:MAG: ABC transporter ATP-binding protein [Betaproteobacteria bacterium]